MAGPVADGARDNRGPISPEWVKRLSHETMSGSVRVPDCRRQLKEEVDSLLRKTAFRTAHGLSGGIGLRDNLHENVTVIHK